MAPSTNILFLMTDQQRWDAVSPALTPNLHLLAQEGVSFSRAYSSTPSCTPARAAILTGRSPWRHGMLSYGNMADEYEYEMPRVLAAKGYRSVAVGKNHFGWDEKTSRSMARGFEVMQIYDGLPPFFDDYDRWFEQQLPGQDPLKSGDGQLGWNTWRGAPYAFDEYYHPTSWTGRTAVEQIRLLANGSQPFFLKISFHRPHSPYDPPQRLFDLQGAPAKSYAVSSDGWDHKYRTCSELYQREAYCGEVTEFDWLTARRAYLACTKHVDEWIGEVLQVLREEQILENTFILFTSDHGDEQMDHFLWKKAYPYEGSTHIPMIIRWPESMSSSISTSRGSTLSSVVELRDVFPTFLDVVGAWDSSWEAALDGRPLTWLLRDDSSSWRSWIDLEHSRFYIGSWSALTDGDIKYVYLASTGDEQLFNLTDDPSESRNLAEDESFNDLRQLWRGRLVSQFEQEERGWGWTFNGGLTARPVIPCVYGHNYPQFDIRKVACDIGSAITFQGLIAFGCLLALLLLCCLGGFCYVCFRRYCRKDQVSLQTEKAEETVPPEE